MAYKTSQEAMDMAEESGDSYSKAFACGSHGISCFGRALFPEAVEHLARSVELSQSEDLQMWEGWVQTFLGEVHFEAGEYASSEDHYGKAASLWTKGFPSQLGLTKIGRAMARMMMAGLDTDVHSLFNHLYENKLKFCEAWKLRFLGKILLNTGDKDTFKAADWIEKAIEAAARNGMKLELARSHSLYAELFKRKGDLPKSREQLSKAIEIFKECGANGWVMKAEEELAKVS